MKPNALIIGGSGGLSGCLAKMALEEYEVWTVTRGQRLLPEGVHSIITDRNNSIEFSNALGKLSIRFDVIFDCICMNEEHALQDMGLLSQYGDRFVIISTDSVYDSAHKKIPQDETAISYCLDGGYAEHKRRMEEAFLSSANPSINWTIFRPGHIYGPGFKLGCYPNHSREDGLLEKIMKQEPLSLVAAGIYIIQPIYVEDLAKVMLDCVSNIKTYQEIFCIGGPDAVENRLYYEYIGEIVNKPVTITEYPLTGFLDNNPGYAGHLCHRIYDLTKLKETGIPLPATNLKDGLAKHINWLFG